MRRRAGTAAPQFFRRTLRILRRPFSWLRPDVAGGGLAKRRVQMTLAILVGLLLIVIGTSIFATQRLYRSAHTRYVEQALPLRTTTRDVTLQMLNEASSVLSYMISDDRTSLRPYFAALDASRADRETLQRLTKQRPELAAPLRDLEAQITSLDGYFARQITFVADGREGAAKARSDVRAATVRFQRFRQTSSELLGAVDRFVANTNAAQRRTFWASVATIGAGGLLALLIALALLRRVPERLRLLYAAEEEARATAEVSANAARALAHIRDAVVLVDDDGVVRLWNAAAEGLLRLPASEAIGRRASRVMWGIEAGEPPAGQSGWVMQIRIEDEEVWVAATVTAFDGGRVFTLRDVTEDQALERARVDFVATASHELRTPVTTIYGAARTIGQQSERLQPFQRQQLLKVMEEEAERLAEIVDRILVSAQLDRGDLSVASATCDVPELCRGVIASVRARHADRAPIALIAPSQMEPLETDASRLRQVLVNLVENGCKYAPPETDMLVRVVDGRDRVRIEVTDAGPGIPAADQERVFEKFFRLDPQMRTGVGGSGLGLYISRQIVERLGGQLTLTSVPGRGSTFAIDLPRASSATVVAAEMAPGVRSSTAP